VVLIAKTYSGRLIAGYSEQAFSDTQIIKIGKGLMLSLWGRKTYELLPNKKAITYDDFYLIWGNS